MMASFMLDPYPGNIHIYDHKVGWIDFGMMGVLTAGDSAYYYQSCLCDRR